MVTVVTSGCDHFLVVNLANATSTSKQVNRYAHLAIDSSAFLLQTPIPVINLLHSPASIIATHSPHGSLGMYNGERLNSISHLVGAVLALIGLGALLTVGLQSRQLNVLLGFSVFGFTLVLLYTMSTLYHSFHPPQLKKLFKILDHISIYLLIAGSYTPFMIITLDTPAGWLILQVVWGLALVGILSEIFLAGRAIKVCQLIIYLSMGWACSFEWSNLKQALPPAGFSWLLTGGLAYTAGVVFYVLDKLKRLTHAHGIWHFFVLLGSASHFIAVLGYVR